MTAYEQIILRPEILKSCFPDLAHSPLREPRLPFWCLPDFFAFLLCFLAFSAMRAIVKTRAALMGCLSQQASAQVVPGVSFIRQAFGPQACDTPVGQRPGEV